MGWLAPLALAGLAALAVPVLVHLVRREEHDALAFPSLMFLERIHSRVRQRRTLRHPWLLALRCLALALVVVAFAGPYWASAPAGAGADGGHDRVIAIDRSYSMGIDGVWERATRAARAALGELDAGGRAALLAFDHDTRVLHELDADHAGLTSALSALRPGSGHTNLVAALERAGNLLASSSAATRDVVVVSDLQSSGIERDGAVSLPPGVTLHVRDVAAEVNETSNAALAGVRVTHARLGGGEAISLAARIVDMGARPAGTVDVRLEVDGAERGRTTVELPAGGSAEVDFDLVVGGGRPSRVRVRVDADDLAADDAYHLVIGRAPALPVLRLRRGALAAARGLHLERALAQGSHPVFELDNVDVDAFDAARLEEQRVVIIDDAPIPGGRAGEALARYVAAGGGLLVIAGDGVQGSWPGGPDGLVPGALGRTRVLETSRPVRVSNLDTKHPALAAFTGEAGGDLAGGLVYRYRDLGEVAERDVVASFDDGAVALAERRVGEGRVLVLATTLDSHWSTLPTLPGFLPMVHDMMKYLGAYVPAPPAFAVGDVVDLAQHARGVHGLTRAAAALARGAEVTVRTPGGARRVLAPGHALLRVDEMGFYEAHVSGGGESVAFAVNPRVSESDLRPLAAAELLARIVHAPAPVAATADGAAHEGEERRQFWWLALLASVLLFALETFAANRLSRRAKVARVATVTGAAA